MPDLKQIKVEPLKREESEGSEPLSFGCVEEVTNIKLKEKG